MNVTIALINSSGCELDRKTVSVRTTDGSFTLSDLADSLGDWPLADGDTIRVVDVL
jgi:hypothetical protein